MSAITQITPALPPAAHGLADYSLLLAQGLRRRGIVSQFVTLEDAPDRIDGFAAARLASPEAEALETALDAAGARTVLLHFCGYNYAHWGLCWWLVAGLRRWRGKVEGRRLVTVFHELYAMGPVWRTSFYTSWPQRVIAATLAANSDAMVTTSGAVAEKVRQWQPDKPIHVGAVFSNVGEPPSARAVSVRGPEAIVFGTAPTRAALYRSLTATSTTHRQALRRLGIERIVDIGPPMQTPAEVLGLPVVALGRLDPGAASDRLADARVGLACYPHHVATKSGVLAAYFAHGLVVVNTAPGADRATAPYVGLIDLARPTLDPDAVAAAGLAWYRGHDRAATAELVLGLLV